MITGIGFTEIALIIIIAIIFFKPEDVPGIIRKIASVFREIEKFSRKARNEINDVIAEPLPFAKDYASEKEIKQPADPVSEGKNP